MPDQTQLDLALAFAAESRAAARNQAFALKARQEGHAQEARLFQAVAQGQSVVARRLLMLLRGKIGATTDNLAEAFGQELPARLRSYQEYQDRAQGAPASAFGQAREVARHQEELYRRWREGAAETYQVCTICGCVLAGEPPQSCPVCGAIKEKFQAVE